MRWIHTEIRFTDLPPHTSHHLSVGPGLSNFSVHTDGDYIAWSCGMAGSAVNCTSTAQTGGRFGIDFLISDSGQPHVNVSHS
jgi:hypothetical protein